MNPWWMIAGLVGLLLCEFGLPAHAYRGECPECGAMVGPDTCHEPGCVHD